MFDREDLARQVLHNCDVSDAKHAGIYSVCGLALRLRDLYKWDQGLNPWEEQDAAQILEWIGAKEELWESLADKDYDVLAIQDGRFDPFDTGPINAVLESHGLLYGAGYAYSMKPTFFLAAIENKQQIDGHTVYFLEREWARDLLTLPALAQDDCILFRQESAAMFLWDQMLYIKQSGRDALHFALASCGLKDAHTHTLRRHLRQLLRSIRETYIYHEIGEIEETVFDRRLWREIIAAYPHSPIELLARAVKDLLADTNARGTLRHIIRQRHSAALGFYVAFYDGLARAIFPELRQVFQAFSQNTDWSAIESTVETGYRKAKACAETMSDLFTEGRQKNDPAWAREAIETHLLNPLLANRN